MRDHGHRRMAVAFDRPEPTFRHERSTTYKANRSAAPDILRQQMGLVRQVVETLGITVLELAGLRGRRHHRHARHPGPRRRASTSSSSPATATAYQLVEDPHVKVLYNRRGVSDYVLYDEAGIEERTGVPPAQYLQYAALRGDPSDNLPGVPGVGEKTAAKLINKYGGLDGIFEHLDEQTPKLRTNLAEHEAQRPPERRGDAAASATCPLGVTIDDLDRKDARRRRGPPPVRLPRVPHALADRLDRGARRGPRASAAAPAEVARGRGHRARRAGRCRRACSASCGPAAPASRWRWPRRGRAARAARRSRAWRS